MKLAYLVIALAVLSLLTACYAPIDNTPPPLPDGSHPDDSDNSTGIDDVFSDAGDIAPPPIPE